MNSGFYYEMFSNFMGKGDKESFSFAFAATQTPYFMIPHPVGSLGVMRHYCRCCNSDCQLVTYPTDNAALFFLLWRLFCCCVVAAEAQ